MMLAALMSFIAYLSIECLIGALDRIKRSAIKSQEKLACNCRVYYAN
ncbi:MAG: hypothetical protein OFPII_12010 [Osedax symbiont Rs1]|nr:MAG: hypothetical protein OFPII_12010 [Osedax symbiont Rs1]